MISRSIVIGVAGGSGSGKTTIVEAIAERIGDENILRIEHDFYYKDHRDLSLEEREGLNYDHPDALETELLIEHLGQLMAGKSAMIPRYDFIPHLREPGLIETALRPVILVDGILVLADKALRRLFDIKIFVDTPADLRFIRRKDRDEDARGRSYEQTKSQWLGTVRQGHRDFVEPSKRHADIIVPQEVHNDIAIDIVVSKIRSAITEG